MVRHAKHVSAVTLLLLSASLPAIAQAQVVGAGPPAVREAIDGNLIDVARGTMHGMTTDISIGPDGPGGLSYNRAFGWDLQGSGYQMTVSSPIGGGWLASDGKRSYAFTLSGSTYTSTDGSGATLTGSGGAYTLTLSDGMIYTYANSVVETGHPWVKARGTTVTYPTGETKTLTWVDLTYCYDNLDGCPSGYNTLVRLQAVANSAGYQLHFNYHRSGVGPGKDAAGWMQIDGITAINTAVDYCNPAAHSCSFSQSWPTVAYSGDPATTFNVTDPGGHTTVYTMNFSAKTYSIKRPASATADRIWTFNPTLHTTTVNNDGLTWTYAYSVTGSTATMTVTDPASQAAVITSDLTVGMPTSVQDALGHTTSYEYYTNGLLKKVTAQEGNYAEYVYDGRGNLTQTTAVAKSGSGLSNIVTSATYPSTCSNVLTCNKPTSTTDARGNSTDYTYDSTHGGVLTVTAPPPVTSGTRPKQTYSYTALQAYYKNSSGTIAASGVPTYQLTGVSTCQTTSSCSGAADEVKTTIAYGSTGVANNLLPTSVSTGAGDASLTATASTTYDAIGNPLTIDGPLSGSSDTTTYRYDADRKLVGTISPDPDGGGSLKRRAVKTTYNGDHQPTVVEIGTVTGTSDSDWTAFATAQQSTGTYDAAGRKTREVVTASSTTYQVIEYDYDAVGRPRCTAVRMNSAVWGTPLGSTCTPGTAGSFGPDRITRNSYDVVGRPSLVQTGYGVSGVVADDVATAYTNNNQVASVTDAEGNKTSYTYDGFDRLSKTSYPSTTKGAGTSSSTDYEELVYDAGSNVTSRRLRGYAGDSTRHIDLTYDNLNRLTAKNLPGSELDVAFTYDLLGRVTGASQTGNALTFSYDALGRMLTQVGPMGTVSMAYDLAGRRTSLTWPDSFYVNYDHLVTGEVTAIRENGATSGVGVLASYAYDDLGRRTSLTYGNGTVTTYGFDNISRLSSLAINLDGGTTTNDVTTSFGYSPAGQVATQTRSNDLYFWDGHYNVNRGYASNGLNQLTTVGAVTPTYDARGNLTASGSDSFGYSSENLMTGATVASTASTLDYDPALRLFKITSGGTGTRFEYDGTEIVTAYTDAGAVSRRYVRGPEPDEVLVAYSGSDTSSRAFLHADERGSIVALSDSSGAKTAINSYDEYGIPASTNAGRFQYTGQVWVPQLGMYYYKARFYSPTLGRFMQTDPLGYGDGMNSYAYVGNDPTNAKDPTGLCGPGDRAPTSEEVAACTASEAERWKDYHPMDYMNGTMMANWAIGQIDQAQANSNIEGARWYWQQDAINALLDEIMTGASIYGKKISDNERTLIRQWIVNSSKNGIIIQEIWSVATHKNGSVDTQHFFEGWELIRGIWTRGINSDTFYFPKYISHLQVTAIARFYDGMRMPDTMRVGNVAQAVSLYSSAKDPGISTPPTFTLPVFTWSK